jgi:voltage-gated potassium channel Kch
MKLLKLLSIYALIGVTSYLWIIFFIRDGAAISFVSNSNVTLIAFALFVVHLSAQLLPRLALDIRDRIAMAGISVLFIPLLIICFAHTYREIGLEGIASYTDYIYFSVVTFTTLGYGDISPDGSARIYAILEAISGFLFVPLLISQLINTTRDASDEYKRDKEDLQKLREVIDRND